MPNEGWKSISLPDEMVDKIKNIIDHNPDLGYRSVSQFIIAAIRENPHYTNKTKKED